MTVFRHPPYGLLAGWAMRYITKSGSGLTGGSVGFCSAEACLSVPESRIGGQGRGRQSPTDTDILSGFENLQGL